MSTRLDLAVAEVRRLRSIIRPRLAERSTLQARIRDINARLLDLAPEFRAALVEVEAAAKEARR